MKIIEQVEIKHFRSFLGTPNPYEAIAENLSDLNIFSGANDSGKSNILRALNLFFNNEISPRAPLEFDRDFFISKKDSSHKVIEIEITFDLSKDTKRDMFMPEKFKIAKYYDRYGFRNYLYVFSLKGTREEVKIDSRAEKNAHIKNIFIKEGSTEKQKVDAEKREWNYRVKFSGFLNKSVSFEYVPAIRDASFFAQLFGRVITRIKSNEDDVIGRLDEESKQITNWQKTIKNKTGKADFKQKIANQEWRSTRLEEIRQQKENRSKLSTSIRNLEKEINEYSDELIKSVDFLDSEFKIGKNLRDFFEGFDVGTGTNRAVSLKLRGDGIQAKFVPKILNFLSSIDSGRKYFIWGFEEPENSAEYKNQQELATNFKNGFTDKQIFITTHSEEFLSLYDSSEIKKEERTANLYHVKMVEDSAYGEYSKIFIFDVDKNEFEFANQKAFLEEDLGQSHLRAKHSKELKQQEIVFLTEKTELQKENNSLREIVARTTKPLVFVEDLYDQLYKIVWLLLNNKSFTEQNFETIFNGQCNFHIYKAEGATCLAGFLRAKNVDHLSSRKIIGVFDFDEEGRKQFKCIHNNEYWNNEKTGTEKEAFLKKRAGHTCFYAMLIPIPDRLSQLAGYDYPSYIEIENLLPESFLKNNNFASEKTTTGNTTYLKVKEDKKADIWRKACTLSKEELKDFKPLFDKITELFS